MQHLTHVFHFLGHKAKRCLLSSKPPENSDISVDVTADIPIVDIDLILQQQNDETVTGSLPTTSASVPHVNSQPELNINFQDVPRLHSDLITDSQEPYVQEDNQIASPTLAKILSPLVNIESTPISASIMETSPSNIINKEVQKTLIVDPLHTSVQASGFESPSRFTALGDVEEAPDEQMSSSSV
ncbi:hypothetical protein F2Q68_00045145 [Brassica cretica]|uniref:Uncharacterized protein n=1 Tax=Brassica cretica TaxID=69181 RepID=A0A8S9LL14_BRACR|nr:hypothetical protein F2Q68_00045145 [Brassica cretica]